MSDESGLNADSPCDADHSRDDLGLRDLLAKLAIMRARAKQNLDELEEIERQVVKHLGWPDAAADREQG